MKIITLPEEMNHTIQELKNEKKTIGFVPTMGSLHEGHLSLIQKAKRQSDIVVLSIFVNPTQFGPTEDFNTYPRDFEKDKHMAETAGVDLLFHPEVDTMYPKGKTMTIKVEERVDVMCGRSRVGHFDGVVTILAKLFNIITPHHVYFGLKDAQQVAVVDSLITHFHYPIKLMPCDTVREQDGLAKSSRNIRLEEDERKEVVHIYRALQEGLVNVKTGEECPEKVAKNIEDYLKKNLKLGTIDYVEVLNYPDLSKSKKLMGRFIMACAVNYKKARLIDNIVADLHEWR